MRLTSFTDYSLRVLMYLGTRPDEKATIAAIAASFDISENHLVKVVHFLGQHGLVATQRGRGGGLYLGLPAEQVRIGDVVRLCEGQAMAAECFDPAASHCTVAPVCRLHGVLREAVKAFEAVLDRYTLADVVKNRDQLARVLFPVTTR
jgi:Rrf2 family transcriptional regulator, nitric oxide-sensitive transcriptional repressor